MSKQQLEIWKDVPDFERLYEVSNFGRVRSKDRVLPYISKKGKHCTSCRKGKLLTAKVVDGKYLQVVLCNNHTRKNMKVHRLVAMAFLPNPNGYLEVNHKDENKLNNHVSNLEWCDRKYNANYGTVARRISDKMLNREDTSRPVCQYSLDGKLIRVYESTNEAQRCTGIDHAHISRCCYGKKRNKTVGGFIWKFK